MTLPVQVFTFVADEAVLVAVGVSDELINLLLSQLTVDDMTFNWPSSDLNVLGQLTVDVRQHKPQFLSWDVAGRWPCCDLRMTLVNPNVTSSHVLRCGRSLTLLWPTSVWPWLTPMWPHLMFWDVAGLLAVKHSKSFSYFLLGVCTLNLFGHHVEELREVHCAAAYTKDTTLPHTSVTSWCQLVENVSSLTTLFSGRRLSLQRQHSIYL